MLLMTFYGSCEAARGAFVGTSPAAAPASGTTLAFGIAFSVFGSCCVLALFLDSGLCHSGYSDSGGGAGETFPAAPGGYLARRTGIGCVAKMCSRKPQVSA